MDSKKSNKYKLSEQGQIAIVMLFQKALATGKDVSDILNQLVFEETDMSNKPSILKELDVENAELCRVTDEELNEAMEEFNASMN